MSSNNNTFIFNLEWAAVLMEYPAEVRHEVYDAIIRYASSGTLSELKPLAKMAFSFIRKEMDYNRAQYEATIERRREAGKRSAEVKAQQKETKPTLVSNVEQSQQKETKPTLVSNVEQSQQKATKPTLVNDVEQSQQKETKPTLVNDVEQSQQKVTKPTYNVNDNVNDNVNVSTTSTETREGVADDVGADGKFLEEFFSDKIAVDAFCMSNRITVEKFRSLAEETVTEWKLTGQKHESLKEAKKHLINQTRKKLQANVTKPQDRYSRRRGADSEARSAEDYTGEI